MSLCTFYLVRHGETDWNEKGLLQGQKNTALNEKGIQQAYQVKNQLQHIHFDVVYSSSLDRTLQTAGIISGFSQDKIQVDNRLLQKSWGEYEGKTLHDFNHDMRPLLEKFNTLSHEEQWTFSFGKGVESDKEVAERVTTSLQNIAKKFLGKKVLVISSSACIQTFLLSIGFASREELPENAITNSSYVEITSDGSSFTVIATKGITLHESQGENPYART